MGLGKQDENVVISLTLHKIEEYGPIGGRSDQNKDIQKVAGIFGPGAFYFTEGASRGFSHEVLSKEDI